MPSPLSFLSHVRIELAAMALGVSGFWLAPENPSLPALLLTAVALPLALAGGLALPILDRREAARAREAAREVAAGAVKRRAEELPTVIQDLIRHPTSPLRLA